MNYNCTNYEYSWVVKIRNNSEAVLRSHYTMVAGVNLLPTRSEERGVLGVGSIPVAILSSCQDMGMLHHNCIDLNMVG